MVRRLLQSVLVIFGVTLITFIALHMGGDPTYLYVSERASPEQIAATRAKLGFDQPLTVQYERFAKGLVHGDLGTSLTYRTPALDVVLDRFPATMELTFFALSSRSSLRFRWASLRRSTVAAHSTAASCSWRCSASPSPASGSAS